jgi:glycosyltransferase involved in cell wall biosynthesis
MEVEKCLIVIAAFNEACGLPQTLAALTTECGKEVDIVVVDDGSTDETALFAEAGGARVIRQDGPKGKCHSVLRGIREGLAPHHTAVITCDGDGQHLAADVRQVMAELRRYDVVFTSRYRSDCPPARGEPPVDRQFLNAMVRAAVERIIPWGLTDPVCGLRGFRTWVARWLLTQEFIRQGYGLELETLFRLCFLQGAHGNTGRFHFTEVPISPVYAGTVKLDHLYGNGPEHVDNRSMRAADHLADLTELMRAMKFHTIPAGQDLAGMLRESGAHLRAVNSGSGAA